ncbi:MAG TPA: hypothetical protein VGJ72_12695 [Polaromonas sp.]
MRKSLDDLYMVIDDEEKKKSRQDPVGIGSARAAEGVWGDEVGRFAAGRSVKSASSPNTVCVTRYQKQSECWVKPGIGGWKGFNAGRKRFLASGAPLARNP